MHNQPDFSGFDDTLKNQWADYCSRPGGGDALPDAVSRSLPLVWACSAFVLQQCLRDPLLLTDLSESGDLQARYGTDRYAAAVREAVDQIVDEAGLMRALRRSRTREMVRIAWRDLAGWAALEETLADLSNLAEAIVATALEWLNTRLAERHGQPVSESGEPAAPVVLAMGKLGGGELNFSSDIDLIVAFTASGSTEGARALSNEDYFKRLTQALIRVLETPTEDGFVYRVDVRLRPFGDSGPLVMSFSGMEDYYQMHGREWERYALIKARPIAGDLEAGEVLLKSLQPFIYRRYLDFNAFESLRGMKRLISQQVARKGLQDNIKLGPGGIREVEFIVQAFQLIRGGQEPRLRARSLMPVLAVLGDIELLPAHAVVDLQTAYRFLRRLENRLQEADDRQTHELPHESSAQQHLAWALDCPDWPALEAKLKHYRRLVGEQFGAVFGAPQVEDDDARSSRHASLWTQTLSEDKSLELLRDLGLDDPAPALEALRAVRRRARYSVVGEQGRRRLNQLMPLLIAAIAAHARPGVVLLRALEVIEAIIGRATYLALLAENPMVLSQLLHLCEASPWLTHQLSRHPILLDDLLDPRVFNSPPTRTEVEAALAQAMARIEAGDLEREMDELRRFKQSSSLRVAAAEISGNMPLMVVSDHLSDIAEVIVQRALLIAWDQMVQRHGRPLMACGREAQFAVVAYGKLGGLELSYASDLDLVFLHDGEADRTTDGDRPIDQQVFFARLAQRIVHLLSTQTSAGIAYDTDLRLRPSGRAGLLVSSLDAFRRYQEADAWIWEHQALVRARAVAGSGELGERFSRVRADVLRRPRNPGELGAAVREMRQRMRSNLLDRSNDAFDLKQGEGGITDIEFLCQYGVLRWASSHTELTRFTDNIRILEGLSRENLISEEDENILADAYRAYRARVHRLALQEQSALCEASEFERERAGVSARWRRWLEDIDNDS